MCLETEHAHQLHRWIDDLSVSSSKLDADSARDTLIETTARGLIMFSSGCVKTTYKLIDDDDNSDYTSQSDQSN